MRKIYTNSMKMNRQQNYTTLPPLPEPENDPPRGIY